MTTYTRTDDEVDCAALSAKKLVLLMYKHLLTQSLTTTTWWHCVWLLYLCICCDVPFNLEWFCRYIKQVENVPFSVKTFESPEVDTCWESQVETELNPTLSYTQVLTEHQVQDCVEDATQSENFAYQSEMNLL